MLRLTRTTGETDEKRTDKKIEIYKETINRGIEDLLEIAEALPDQRLSELDDYVLELDDLKVGTHEAVMTLLRSAGTKGKQQIE